MATENQRETPRSDSGDRKSLRTPSSPRSSSPPPSPSSSSLLSNHSRRSRRDSRDDEDVGNRGVKEEDEIFMYDDDDDELNGSPYPGYNNFGLYGPIPAHHHVVSANRKKIIQKILAQFDLEEVMDRYRGDSVKKSIERQKLRQWVESMMESDKAKMSDREWNDQFRQKVMEEYERKQEEKERRLAEGENQRILKLKILGIIRDEEEEARRAEMENRKTPSERKFERRATKKHQSIFKPMDIETQMEILNRDESEVRNRQLKQNGEDENTEENNEEQDRESYDDPKTFRGHLGRAHVDKKVVHPNLKDLYHQEDLDQLYREAESLIRRTRVK